MPPDGSYTMQEQGVQDQALSGDGSDPSLAAPAQMDPGMMASLFGGDDQGTEQVDPGAEQVDPGADQGGGDVDQGKLQSVLSDPGLLMAVAAVLKTLGQGEDTDLVHVTEEEKAMLKQGGGQGTRNPTTGLLQYLKKEDVETDWFGMHPDDRVKLIGGRWSNPRSLVPGATQGGMTRNMTGEDFANANVAVTPSWGVALNMAGLVTGMATGGPLGGIMGALESGLADKLSTGLIGDNPLTGSSSFDTPGPRLSPDEVAAIADAYNKAALRGLPTVTTMSLAEDMLAGKRGQYGGGPGGQPGGVAPGAAGGIGVDQAGNAYGTNIGGAGMSHNLAAVGGNMAAARALADRARAFAAGGYGRATPAGSDGGGGRDAGGGGDSGGGNRGGGQDGGRHGGPGGSNRSA